MERRSLLEVAVANWFWFFPSCHSITMVTDIGRFLDCLLFCFCCWLGEGFSSVGKVLQVVNIGGIKGGGLAKGSLMSDALEVS